MSPEPHSQTKNGRRYLALGKIIKSAFTALPRLHRRLVMIISTILLLIMALPSPDSLLSKQVQSSEITISLASNSEAEYQDTDSQWSEPMTLPLEPESLPTFADDPQPTPESELRWQEFTVRSGDNLSILFKRAGLSAKTLHDITQLPIANKLLPKIKPGQTISLAFLADDFNQLKYVIDPKKTLHIEYTQAGFSEQIEVKPSQFREFFAEAEIQSNFWSAATKAGLSPNQIMQFAGIFGWDVDFALDIRQGDRFSMVYSKEFVDGDHVGDGTILVAEFINQGQTFKAVRYTDNNYYDEKGNAMRKAFLRAPVQFNYVSSDFNPRRLHPVTGRVTPHRGTDYVAPVGTPIMAAGDGTVVSSNFNEFNGHYVFIKHSNTYVTKYLHLKKRKVKKGQKVRQGQIIGTLGSSGRVTGAHLHYEFLVNGVHNNPRTVELPKSQPIARSERAAFDALAAKRFAQLAQRQSKNKP